MLVPLLILSTGSLQRGLPRAFFCLYWRSPAPSARLCRRGAPALWATSRSFSRSTSTALYLSCSEVTTWIFRPKVCKHLWRSMENKPKTGHNVECSVPQWAREGQHIQPREVISHLRGPSPLKQAAHLFRKQWGVRACIYITGKATDQEPEIIPSKKYWADRSTFCSLQSWRSVVPSTGNTKKGKQHESDRVEKWWRKLSRWCLLKEMSVYRLPKNLHKSGSSQKSVSQTNGHLLLFDETLGLPSPSINMAAQGSVNKWDEKAQCFP